VGDRPSGFGQKSQFSEQLRCNHWHPLCFLLLYMKFSTKGLMVERCGFSSEAVDTDHWPEEWDAALATLPRVRGLSARHIGMAYRERALMRKAVHVKEIK
jgi:hypothetical protein